MTRTGGQARMGHGWDVNVRFPKRRFSIRVPHFLLGMKRPAAAPAAEAPAAAAEVPKGYMDRLQLQRLRLQRLSKPAAEAAEPSKYTSWLRLLLSL